MLLPFGLRECLARKPATKQERGWLAAAFEVMGRAEEQTVRLRGGREANVHRKVYILCIRPQRLSTAKEHTRMIFDTYRRVFCAAGSRRGRPSARSAIGFGHHVRGKRCH